MGCGALLLACGAQRGGGRAEQQTWSGRASGVDRRHKLSAAWSTECAPPCIHPPAPPSGKPCAAVGRVAVCREASPPVSLNTVAAAPTLTPARRCRLACASGCGCRAAVPLGGGAMLAAGVRERRRGAQEEGGGGRPRPNRALPGVLTNSQCTRVAIRQRGNAGRAQASEPSGHAGCGGQRRAGAAGNNLEGAREVARKCGARAPGSKEGILRCHRSARCWGRPQQGA